MDSEEPSRGSNPPGSSPQPGDPHSNPESLKWRGPEAHLRYESSKQAEPMAADSGDGMNGLEETVVRKVRFIAIYLSQDKLL
jgi:hypothetical protein